MTSRVVRSTLFAPAIIHVRGEQPVGDPRKFSNERKHEHVETVEADDREPDADAGDDVDEGTGSPRRLAGTDSGIGLRRQSTVGCSRPRRAGGR